VAADKIGAKYEKEIFFIFLKEEAKTKAVKQIEIQ